MEQQLDKQEKWSVWRRLIWPIYGNELKKILPLLSLSFLITFIYSILRNIKDALIVTAPKSGAEVIPFLTLGGVIPAVLLGALIYSKLSNKLSKESLFYVTFFPFILFFILFAFVLFPYKEILHPNMLADKLELVFPEYFNEVIALFRNWTYGLFFIMEELWSSFIIGVLFWGFANDIIRISEAKRFYALFGLGANLALILTGPVTKYILTFRSANPSVDPLETPITILMIICIVASFLIFTLYRWINKNVMTDKQLYNLTEQMSLKEDKPQLSIIDSLKFISKVPAVLYIGILVLSYNTVINILEVMWKNQVKIAYPSNIDYLNFMSNYSIILGTVTILVMLFITNNSLRRFGWAFTTYITPLLMFITGLIFLLFVLFEQYFSDGLLSFVVVAPIGGSVFLGTFQNIVSKVTKYALFDPTKEMAYIPLDQESKIKGKAFIDAVGSRVGKSLGSGIQLILLAWRESLVNTVPQVIFVLGGISLIWFCAIKKLDAIMCSNDSTTKENEHKIVTPDLLNKPIYPQEQTR